MMPPQCHDNRHWVRQGGWCCGDATLVPTADSCPTPQFQQVLEAQLCHSAALGQRLEDISLVQLDASALCAQLADQKVGLEPCPRLGSPSATQKDAQSSLGIPVLGLCSVGLLQWSPSWRC